MLHRARRVVKSKTDSAIGRRVWSKTRALLARNIKAKRPILGPAIFFPIRYVKIKDKGNNQATLNRPVLRRSADGKAPARLFLSQVTAQFQSTGVEGKSKTARPIPMKSRVKGASSMR